MPALDPAAADADGAAGDPFRDRLLDGLAASIAQRGYRDTTVADIVRNAKTSKRTFYVHFSGKDAALLELLEADNVRMIAGIRAAVDPDADWRVQVQQAVEAYVAAIGANPALTLAWIREFPALGEAVRPVQRRGMRQFTDMLVELTSGPGFRRSGLPTVSRRIALILLGGLRELTAYTLEDGEDIHGITDIAVAASAALLTTSGPGARTPTAAESPPQ